MNAKINNFLNRKLKTMVIEIDITKTDKSFKDLLITLLNIEDIKLSEDNLEIKDIYFK